MDQTLRQEILTKIDHIAFYKQYLKDLKKTGAALWSAKCIFHSDTDPSLKVYATPEKGWHCFGCSEGGDTFGFVMQAEGLSFREALQRVADFAGVEVQDNYTVDQRLLDLHEMAADTFAQGLASGTSRHAEAARTYLVGRGIDECAIAEWKVGFAPATGKFIEYMTNQGVSADDLIALGLVSKKTGKEYFTKRVMFPICNPMGRSVGFGGRVYDGNGGRPKYINSPGTKLFRKGDCLYGAEKLRGQNDTVYVVEGYTDTISMWQQDYAVVGLMGVALNSGQIKQLSRKAKRICLLLDGDESGFSVVEKQARIPGAESLYAALLPHGEDPDSLCRQGKIQECLDVADVLIEVYMKSVIDQARGRLNGAPSRDAVIKKVLPVIGRLTPVANDFYIGLLARLLGASKVAVLKEVQKADTFIPDMPTAPSAHPSAPLEDVLAGLSVMYPGAGVALDLFESEQARRLVEASQTGLADDLVGYLDYVLGLAGSLSEAEVPGVVKRLEQQRKKRKYIK